MTDVNSEVQKAEAEVAKVEDAVKPWYSKAVAWVAAHPKTVVLAIAAVVVLHFL